MLATLLVGVLVYRDNGVPSRYPEFVHKLMTYKFDAARIYRKNTCFLSTEQNYDAFENCNLTYKENRKTVFLWGDSHAAQLYPGLEIWYDGSLNIVQRTMGGCPPIENYDMNGKPNCKKTNDSIIKEIRSANPDILIIAAAWWDYDWRIILETLKSLKKNIKTQIYIVGPVPRWDGSLKEQLWKRFNAGVPHHLPYRMRDGLLSVSSEIDKEMRTALLNETVHYISPIEILCDVDGCITRFSDEVESITSWDYAHLTIPASRFLVSQFKIKLK
jgi:hypothetical protein